MSLGEVEKSEETFNPWPSALPHTHQWSQGELRVSERERERERDEETERERGV